MTQHPPTEKATTLAQFVQKAREAVGITQGKLAELANLPVNQVEDIETGIELTLSPSVRQKLAKVLKLRPVQLKNLEKQIQPPRPPLSLEARERYIDEILHYPDQSYPCPQCGTELLVRVFQRRDLEDNLLLEVKAHCPQCLFKL